MTSRARKIWSLRVYQKSIIGRPMGPRELVPVHNDYDSLSEGLGSARAILVLALSVENVQLIRAPLWFRRDCQASDRGDEAVGAFDAAIETLAFEHADLDLNPVEPAGVLRRVVELKPPERAARFGCWESA